MTWLRENACAAVRYRVPRDVLRRPPGDPELVAAARAVATYQPALDVAAAQDAGGTWAGRLHTGDSRVGVRWTTEVQFPRLVEYGWDTRSEAVARTATYLRRLLPRGGAETQVDYRDLASYMKGTRRRRYVISFARSIAAGLLAHAGLGEDPLVLEAARELLAATYRFVTGPAAAKPVRGYPPTVIEEAYDAGLGYPAIPDLYLLQLFAYCPSLAAGEGRHQLQAVVEYVLGPAYAGLPRGIGYVALEGKPVVKGWKIELPPPDELARAGLWSYGLIVLEMLARVTSLAGHPRPAAYLAWLRRWRRPDGLYDVPVAALGSGRRGLFAERVRLAPNWGRPAWRLGDVTFRALLIEALLEE